jgi:hypothetical protein
MAATPTVDDKDKIAAEVKELDKVSKELDRLSSAGSDVRCMWDIVGEMVGPSLEGNRYARQCKMPALVGLNLSLCRVHALKKIKLMKLQKRSDYLVKTGEQQSKFGTSESIDYKNVNLTLREIGDVIEKQTKGEACAFTEDEASKMGAVYDRTTAACLLLDIHK